MANNSPISNSEPRALEQPRQNRDGKTKEREKANKNATKGGREGIREEPDGKKKPIWRHEWTSPKSLATEGSFGIHEIVQGPFVSPRLVVASPCVVHDSSGSLSNVRDRFCKGAVGIRRGIPDPWIEYLALRGYCTEYDRRIAKRHLLLGCDSVRLTEAAWHQLGLTFTQGIPDPWKMCPRETRNIPREDTSRYQRGKSRIILRGTSGDPEDPSTECSTMAPVSFPADGNCADDRLESRAPVTGPGNNPGEHPARAQRAKRLSEDGEKSMAGQHRKNRRSCDAHGEWSRAIETSARVKDGLSCGLPGRNTSGNKMTRVSRRSQQEPRYHRRFHQPEAAPAKHNEATRTKGGNLWRCTRHQPGSSYRLEATQIFSKASKCHGAVDSEDRTSLESAIVRGPCLSPCLGKSVVGMVRSLLVGLRQRSECTRPEDRYWNGDAEKPEIHLICCRCSCPYLKVAEHPDRDGRPCVDRPKEARGRKRTEKPEVGHPENRESVTATKTQGNPADERAAEDGGKSIDGAAKDALPLPVEVGDCRSDALVEYISPESGANADISDASIRTNVSITVNLVTSSTLIDLMKNKSRVRTATLVLNQDCRDVCVESSRRESRRTAKRACPINKSSEETKLRAGPNANPSNASEGVGDCIVERKTSGSETEGRPGVRHRESLPDSSSRERPLDGSPGAPVSETENDVAAANEREKSLSEDGECLFIIDNAVNLSATSAKSDHRLPFGAGYTTRKPSMERTTSPTLVKGGANKVTIGRTSKVRMIDDQRSVSPETPGSSAPTRSDFDKVESKVKTSRGTDALGVETLLGPCVRRKHCWRSYRPIIACPNIDRCKKSRGIKTSSRTRNERRAIDGKCYEMVEPFVKDVSEDNDQSGNADEPDNETCDTRLDERDKMAAPDARNGRLGKCAACEKSPTKIGFVANATRNRASSSRTAENRGFERKPKKPSEDELYVQSYSETEDNLEK